MRNPDVQHETQGINRGFCKPMMQIKGARSLMQGMNQQRTYASLMRQAGRAQDRIAQQIGPQAETLMRPIDREPSQHHDGHWIGHVAPYCIGRRSI